MSRDRYMGAPIIAKTSAMPRDEWLELRRGGIGGSDAAAICGLSKYSSPMAVYADKLGVMPDKEQTEPMRFGTDMEPYVAQRFTESTGKKLRCVPYMLRHPRYPWMIADIDRRVMSEYSIAELKTAGDRNPYAFTPDDFDPAYYVQCMHYLAVTGADKAYLAVYRRATGLHVIEFEPDEGEINTLIEIERKFWEDNVLKALPPDPDGEAITGAAIKALFPRVERKHISLAGMEDTINERVGVNDSIKNLKKIMETCDQKIKLAMGDAEVGHAQGYTVRWPVTKNGQRRFMIKTDTEESL